MSKKCRYCSEVITYFGGFWVIKGDGTIENKICQAPSSPNFRHKP